MACAVGPSVSTSSTHFSFKMQFFGIYLNFQWQKSLRKSMSHSESKSYQINSIKSCSSRSFQQHQRHIPIPPKFSVKKSFNIQELLHCKSKCYGTKPMHPSSSRACQRHQKDKSSHCCSQLSLFVPLKSSPSSCQ